MSVSEREVPFEIAREGGFPTEAEFQGVWSALVDVDEFGLVPMLGRLAGPLVDSYEGDTDQRIGFNFADLGLLVSKANSIVGQAERVLEHAKHLQRIAVDIGDALDQSEGRMEGTPTFDRDGFSAYSPSRDSLERWGLVKPRGESDAR